MSESTDEYTERYACRIRALPHEPWWQVREKARAAGVPQFVVDTPTFKELGFDRDRSWCDYGWVWTVIILDPIGGRATA